MSAKTAVILLNMGGPDSLKSVRPFLYNLFSDREIIRLGPAFMQRPLARFISGRRAPKSEKLYSMIGGKSPLADITSAQARELSEKIYMPVYVGMRYWHPFIEDVVNKMKADGIDEAIGLSLYPQYSFATSGSTLREFERASAKIGMRIKEIRSWSEHPAYIKEMAGIIEEGLRLFGPDNSDVEILYSAHSLPRKFIDEGDPYVKETLGTIRAIEKLAPRKWHLGYQSRSGPVKWLSPSTGEVIKTLSNQGVKRVLAVPISFVSDHIETLYEIDILYRGMASELGIELRRTEAPNTRPGFIEALAELVRESAV